ncbi:MAG TPA: M20/M25/M40 family metallo-hydrolase [Blastocatellia bacterium]|jgi:acetylornithine deacetylase/succinyl-diaminopimelate desuccinylase-like protein
MKLIKISLASFVVAFALSVAPAQTASTDHLSAEERLAREIFQQLIEINTTDSVGDTTAAAKAMAERLKAAGFPDEDVKVLGPNPRKGNLVARLRGTGARKPILLLAHLDVVEAKPEDWSFDPFKFLEKDGYYYGRGTSDDKAMAAIFIANLIRFKQEGFKPDRDIIVALTADEEGGDYNGVEWLLKNHPQLIEAEFGINEGGGGAMRGGKKLFNAAQASEKIYQSFLFEVKNKGGHSSRPVKENAIYQLAAALQRLAAFDFPVDLNEVTRAYFERLSKIEMGETAAAMKGLIQSPPDPGSVAYLGNIPAYNATMRTTCVATMLQAGHAENALPQTARATVNCRILPTETAEATLATLVKVVGDSRVAITPIRQPKPSPPSPLSAEVMKPIEAVTQQLWPGAPVVPIMGTGATDSLYLRKAGIPMYGASGIFSDIDDGRAHGKDERVAVKSFYEGQEYLYRLVKAFASPTANQRPTTDK